MRVYWDYIYALVTSLIFVSVGVLDFGSMACEQNFYQLNPLKLGAEVHGISLQTDTPREVIEQIKRDVTRHRLLVFRKQGELSGKCHVDISRWFGNLESTFYKHPRSPHPDVFRVSNDNVEGCTGVGRTGWHIDGSFQPAPFGYSLYHIISVPSKGNTVFAPLTEIIEGLDAQKRARWERLWMRSNRRGGVCHPMIYSHPVTGKPVLCFHLGMTWAYVWDYGTPEERVTDEEETEEIKEEIYHEFVKNNMAVQYSHKYEAGDFIISDNLAVGHEAHPDTQLPRSQVGLRVMHRTTIQGTVPPSKTYKPTHEQREEF